MNSLESHTFRAVSFPWRLHVGVQALDQLSDEVRRTRAQRAFVICGQTVAHKTNLLQRVKDQLGSLYAGVFDAMDKDSSWPAVQHGWMPPEPWGPICSLPSAVAVLLSAPVRWRYCWRKMGIPIRS